MKWCVVMAAAALTACGPMVSPMVPRLSDEEQKVADQEWHNLVTPPDRLDRDVLYCALTMFQLYQLGVDRADFHSEKRVGDMRVVMDVRYLKDVPNADAFYITIYDLDGKVLRSERYSRDDYIRLSSKVSTWTGSTTSGGPETEEVRKEREAREDFLLKIQSATRPAGWVPETQPGRH